MSDEFTKHLARVRDRFAAALNGKIDETFAGLETLAGPDEGALPAVINVHRRLHEMCGIAPTLGFPATGKAARDAEAVMREPAKTGRRLRVNEIAALKIELDTLRGAARKELRTHASTGVTP